MEKIHISAYMPTLGVKRTKFYCGHPHPMDKEILVFNFIETSADMLKDNMPASPVVERIASAHAHAAYFVTLAYDMTSRRTFETAKDYLELANDFGLHQAQV